MTENDDELTEAQVAEANDDDDDTETTGEPEPDEDEQAEAEEPQPDLEPASDAVAEAKGQEWDRVNRYLAKNVGDIEGDNAVHLTECPMCRSQGTPGYVDPRIKAPPEVIGAIMQWLGMRDQSDLKKDPYARMCDTCGGETETLSGAGDRGQKTLTCLDCQGRGWVPVGTERAGGFTPLRNGQSAAYPPESAADTPPLLTTGPEPPEVQALRAQGYTVIQPFTTGAAS